MAIHFRPAQLSDAGLLLAWRNDPETVRHSLQSKVVKTEEHRAWLDQILGQSERILLIALEGQVPVGTVRLDPGPQGHELSWTVAPEARRRGIGLAIVQAGCGLVTTTLWARAKCGNVASLKILARAGFKPGREENGVQYFEFKRKL